MKSDQIQRWKRKQRTEFKKVPKTELLILPSATQNNPKMVFKFCKPTIKPNSMEVHPLTTNLILHFLYHGCCCFIPHFAYHHTTGYGNPSASNTTFPSIYHSQFITTTITTSTPTIPLIQFITTTTTFPTCDLCELGNFDPHSQCHIPFSLCSLHKGEGQRGRARRHWECEWEWEWDWEWEWVRGRETVGNINFNINSF